MISKAIFLGSKSLGLTVLKSLVKANDKVGGRYCAQTI